MKRYDLNGSWQLKVLGENIYHIPEEYVEAKVPGTVFGTYVENGMMPDPYYRENELTAVKLADNDFVYRKCFVLAEEQLHADRLLLVFEGIDTLADIYVNGQLVETVFNMHVRHEIDVLDVVRQGENELKVVLHSPTKYIKAENEKVYAGGSTDAMEGYPHLRKAHCMFGWDWGPRLPDSGIFRPVYLLAVKKARLKEVYVRQEHTEGRVRLSFDVLLEEAAAAPCVPGAVSAGIEWRTAKEPLDEKLKVVILLTAPDGRRFTAEAGREIIVDNPALWWPSGYGSQPLYMAHVFLHREGAEGEEVLDEWERRIGLRRMEVNTEPDEWGRQFAHQVNGVRIFAMGADYIPEDNLSGRINETRTRKLLEDAAAANYNCIRVWGGGYYPDDYFFDICDELGLLVWQDFMFACSAYELDAAFDKNIRREIAENVRRIRHHACLALWCGNNEMETQTLDGAWKPSKKQTCDYNKIFEYIIPEIVKREDPQTFYWPSSPSSGGSYDDPWDENRGDTHYWGVWHGEKPFTSYRDYKFR